MAIETSFLDGFVQNASSQAKGIPQLDPHAVLAEILGGILALGDVMFVHTACSFNGRRIPDVLGRWLQVVFCSFGHGRSTVLVVAFGARMQSLSVRQSFNEEP